jgi:predicted enzyme related to lactoylglutathione lyase
MGNLSPTPRTYPAGVTSWVEVALPDLAAGLAFYGSLFGWQFDGLVATLDGLDVASVGDGPAPAAWTTYVAVDDADAVARAMADQGAELVSPPEDARDDGRAAILRDPQGAEIRLWQARRRLGAQLTNSPGTWNFSDLHTEDPSAAERFYTEVFGWRVVDQGWGHAIQVPGYGDHLEATVDPDIRTRQGAAPEGFEDVIGGLSATEEGEPNHWHVTFSVADRDESADLVETLGGRVLRRREDDWTRNALVSDPQGASFTISQFAPKEWS